MRVTSVYGVACYALFGAALVVLAGLIGNAGPLWHIDGPARLAPLAASGTDIGLIALFGLQHSGMARRGFKRLWLRLIPATVERSTYVLASSIALVVVCALWQPVPGVIWVAGPTVAVTLGLIGGAGLMLAVVSSFAIDHFALLGLRQSGAWRGVAAEGFTTPWPYRLVRHPIYLGTLLALWAVPRMTVGHLIFSAALSLYTVAGALLEERDLVARFGDTYRQYRARVPMLLPGRRGNDTKSRGPDNA
jgi:protein-S-isoprenylcysteine O-methyltransferase Ste14